MAPAARHTKSAAWALTTRTVFRPSSIYSTQSDEFVTAMRRISATEKPASSRFCANGAKTFRNQRVYGLTQVCREQTALKPRAANVREYRLPLRFAGIRGGEAMFDDGAEIGQFGLLFAAQVLRWEFGVGHQDLAQAHFLCALHQRENLVASQVSGGQNHIVPADQLHAGPRLWNQIAGLVDDAHTRRRDAHGGKFALNFGPKRKLFVAAVGRPAVSFSASTVGIQTSLQPERPAISTATGLRPPTAWFKRDRAKRRNSRNRFGHHLGALGSGNVVRFQDEALQAAR